MLENTNITFIGSGAMGEAIIKGLIAENIAQPKQLTASGPAEPRRTHMEREYGIRTETDNVAAVQQASIVILCVKPQILEIVAAGLQGKIPADTLIISIIAGATLQTLRDSLAHQRVVRSMPNTPVQVNMGATVWIADESVSHEQREQTETILGALGEQIQAQKEEYIDMQTGLGGSGPGFVFLIIEAMIDAGVQMGFTRQDAEIIVLQTIAGSVELVRSTGTHPAILRNLVTSAGGTTAAGLYELEKGGLRTVLTDGILAAYRRSQELGAPDKS